jgi:hypothetical protein
MLIDNLSEGNANQYEDTFQLPWIYAHNRRVIQIRQYMFRVKYKQLSKDQPA